MSIPHAPAMTADGGGLRPVRIVYLYAPAEFAARNKLEAHLWGLRWQRIIDTWDHSKLLAGDRVSEIKKRLIDSDLLIVLVSAELFAEDKILDLLTAAVELSKGQRLQIIPMLLRAYDLEATPLAGFVSLPAAGAIESQPDKDAAWRELSIALRRLLRTRAEQAVDPLPVPLALRHWSTWLLARVAESRRFIWLLLLIFALFALRQLGKEVHQSRLSIVGFSQASQVLSYAESELFETGLAALWYMGKQLIAGPLQGEKEELVIVPLCALAVFGAWLLGWRVGPRARMAWLGLVLPLCFLGAVWLKVGVRQQHILLPSNMVQATSCRTHDVGSTVQPTPRLIAAEVCSWLYNDKPENPGRLAALQGGWLWAVLTLAMLAALVARTRGLGQPGRLVGAVGGTIYVLLVGFLLVDIPRVYALSAYGLHYPAVRRLSAACGAELRAAVEQHRCQAWDTSANAQQQLLYLRGDCPGYRTKDMLWHPSRCVEQLGNVEVMDHEGGE